MSEGLAWAALQELRAALYTKYLYSEDAAYISVSDLHEMLDNAMQTVLGGERVHAHKLTNRKNG